MTTTRLDYLPHQLNTVQTGSTLYLLHRVDYVWMMKHVVRVAVSLRLGVDICQPHTCFCGAAVDVKGSLALSCKRSNGRIIRHNNLNDIILHSLMRTNIPAMKEPNGPHRADDKQPDGLTLLPWREDRCLVWDVTIVNTIAASYLTATSTEAGSAAELAASCKEVQYQDLTERYVFVPIAIESLGPLGSKATSFLSELGRRFTAATSNVKETSYSYQRISAVLQRFNAICIYNTFRDVLYDDKSG